MGRCNYHRLIEYIEKHLEINHGILQANNLMKVKLEFEKNKQNNIAIISEEWSPTTKKQKYSNLQKFKEP